MVGGPPAKVDVAGLAIRPAIRDGPTSDETSVSHGFAALLTQLQIGPRRSKQVGHTCPVTSSTLAEDVLRSTWEKWLQ